MSGYRLIARIGEGGMGIVHLAQRGSEPRVALKVLRPHIVGDDEARRRLAREVNSLRRIRSPWVAEIVDADPWAPVPYVATRYVPGLSLYDHVHEEGRVLGDDLLWLAAALAEGIASVHAVGVLHRDVKPSNVLMEGRTPILIDFGLARVADDPRLTHTGWLLGTPGYLAPEILHGENATPASDLHSWAATVAFAGLGRAPFGSGPAMAVMDRVRRGEFDLDGLGGPQGSASLRALVASALAPDPARRPPLDDVVAWLRRQVPTLGPSARAREEDPFAEALALFEPVPEQDPFADAMALFDPPADPPADSAPRPGDRGTAPRPVLRKESLEEPASDPHTRQLTEFVSPTVAERISPPMPRAVPLAAPRSAPQPPAWTPSPVVRPVYDDPPYPLPHQLGVVAEPRPSLAVRARRAVLGAVLVLLAGMAATAAPWVTLVCLSLLVWVLRSGSLAGSAAVERRSLRGGRWYDPLQLVLASPWHAVQALPGAGLLLVWAAGLAVSAGLVCYAAAAGTDVTLFVCGVAFGLSVWWGPGGSRFRGPVSRLTHPLCESVGAWLIGLAALGVLLVAGLLVLGSSGIWWAPAGGPPLGEG